MNRNIIANYTTVAAGIIGVCVILTYVLTTIPLDREVYAGIIITLVSLIFLIMARLELGASFTVRPRATALVTTGIYSKIRHPIYVFAQFMILGIILAIHGRWLILIWALLVFLQTKRARAEERVLEERFGETYRAYKKTTWF